MDSRSWAGIAAPRLTEADKVALADVRGSWPAKMLGRTMAVIAALVLLIGLAGLAGLELEGQDAALSPIWLHWLLLIGIPALVVLTQLRAEWRAARNLRTIQDLASREAEIPQGFFRIGPYQDSTQDRDVFDRADGVHRHVLLWLQRAEAVPLYLTGDSGSGKSSLLNAFVLPALRARGWTVVPIRASDDLEAALIEALPAGRWAQVETMRDRIEAAASGSEGPLLLVLDQFEEFLIQAAPGRRRAFAEMVADLEARPVANLKLLLVPRGDFMAELTAAGLPGLFRGPNTVRVGPFPIEAARSLLMGARVGLSAELLDRLLASAAALDETPGMVSPITLNVLGFILKRRRLTVLTPDDAGRLVRDYVARTVDSAAIRDRSRPVLQGLVTDRGTTRARSEMGLSSEASLRVPEVRAVLAALTEAGLARPLAHGFWELSHDFVAQAVKAYLETRLAPSWRPRSWARAGHFAAPALLALSLPVSSALFRANWIPRDQAVAALKDGGIATETVKGRATASWTARDKPVDVEKAAPSLRRLGVQDLRLASAPIDDLHAMRTLTTLRALDLSRTYTANLDPLRSLTQLQSLNLAGTLVSNLNVLQGMKVLRWLDLAGTPVANLEPLRNLATLQSLDLSRTAVTTIEMLRGLTALQSLDLANTRVANLDPLRTMTMLRSLDLTGTQVNDLAPLSNLTGLRWLKLWRTPSGTLEPLRNLTELRTLDASGSPVVSIEPLRALTALRSLDLSETPVTNLEPLRGMTALGSLSLAASPVSNIKPLRSLPALSFLDLRLTRTSPEEVGSFVKARAAMGLPPVSILR